jgi:hypothetical protein
MRIRTFYALSFTVVAIARQGVAADYDGKQPFICAPAEIVACGSGAECGKETATSIDFPPFLRFDIAQNEITGTRPSGEMLKAQIDTVRHTETDMMLQGVDGNAVWSAKIAESTGDMTIVAARDQDGFVAFGACTLR